MELSVSAHIAAFLTQKYHRMMTRVTFIPSVLRVFNVKFYPKIPPLALLRMATCS